MRTVVTQADKRSEAAIVKRLTEFFPEHGIAAEEAAATKARRNRSTLACGSAGWDDELCAWLSCFCVSLGLAHRDAVIAGVVFNPFYNELFAAARGQGATLNGKRIQVSKVATLATSLLCTGFPVHKRLANPNIHYYWDSRCARTAFVAMVGGTRSGMCPPQDASTASGIRLAEMG